MSTAERRFAGSFLNTKTEENGLWEVQYHIASPYTFKLLPLRHDTFFWASSLKSMAHACTRSVELDGL